MAALVLALAAQAHGQAAWTEGEVRKVDAAAGKITLKHGEIKDLDMPPMTMVFRVRDPAWLSKLKPGDKVRFTAEKLDGQYTVTGLQPLR
jgi:Cu/Ag efflux protein CusF